MNDEFRTAVKNEQLADSAWPERIAPYSEHELAEMQRIFQPSMIQAIRDIEAMEFEWEMTGVPFPPGLGRLNASEPVRPWSVPRQTAWILYSLALVSAPRVCVEIGTSFGFSTLWLAAGIQNAGGVVHTVEMMPEKVAHAERFFELAGLPNICLHRTDAQSFSRNFNKEIDLLFLDADAAAYPVYWKELKLRMSRNAVVIADNLHTHPSLIAAFIREIRESGEYSDSVLPIDNGLLIARRKCRL